MNSKLALRNAPCRQFLFAVLCAVLALVAPRPSAAAPGDLDTSFDQDGKMSHQFPTGSGNRVEDVIVLSDGSSVLAGAVGLNSTDWDFSISKILPDGSFDSNFGNGGTVEVPFDLGGGFTDYGMAIARQSDGKFVVGGYAETAQQHNFDFAVCRLLANGSLDTSFGTGGKQTVAIDGGGFDFDIVTDVLIQNDGKIVLVGWAGRANDDSDFAAARLNANGTIDTSFGYQGKATVAFDYGGLARDEAHAAALQSDGKIVMVGSAERNNYDFDFAVARLTTSGQLDSSFLGGKTTVAFDRGGANQDYAADVVIDGSGRIVVAGRSEGTTLMDHDFAVARLLPTGALDTSFDADGKVTIGINHGDGLDQAEAVALAPGNQLIVAGTNFYAGADGDFAAIRLNQNGSLDTQFGMSGRSIVAFDVGGDKMDRALATAIGLDGDIVIAGTIDYDATTTGFGVLRLLGTPWISTWP